MSTYLAIDLGGESGRVLSGRFDGERLGVELVHRFANRPVVRPDGLYWDVIGLYRELLAGIALSQARLDGPVSVSVDGWGNDFALLDDRGALLAIPRHHRDVRAVRMPALIAELVGEDAIYRRTGVLSQSINAASQLLAMRDEAALPAATRLSLLPDLFLQWLSGVPVTERTIASTTQLLDLTNGQWATDLIGQLGLPSRPFAHPVVAPATPLDGLRASQELGPTGPVRSSVVTASRPPRVVTVAGHDTACAVAALPARGPSFGYIVCGTWSLVGVELATPITTTEARLAGFTNEAGLDGTFRFLRNGTGLWLLQACRRSWGESVSYSDLAAQAVEAPAFATLIDPDHPGFLPVGDMPARIVDFCVRSGQSPPADRAAMVRCVLDSLALSYRRTVDLAESLVGRRVEALHLVGGGSANDLLCQTTADVTGRVVLAGPDEASGIGNLLIQAIAQGELSSMADLRAVVAASFPPVIYHPRLDGERVDDVVDRFEQIAAME